MPTLGCSEQESISTGRKVRSRFRKRGMSAAPELMMTAPVLSSRLAYTLTFGFVDPDDDYRITRSDR